MEGICCDSLGCFSVQARVMVITLWVVVFPGEYIFRKLFFFVTKINEPAYILRPGATIIENASEDICATVVHNVEICYDLFSVGRHVFPLRFWNGL